MSRISKVVLPNQEVNNEEFMESEIYIGRFGGILSLFLSGADEVIRISADGRVRHGTKKMYVGNVMGLKKVTDKVRIIVED